MVPERIKRKTIGFDSCFSFGNKDEESCIKFLII